MNIWPPTIETGATVCPLELLNQRNRSAWNAMVVTLVPLSKPSCQPAAYDCPLAWAWSFTL